VVVEQVQAQVNDIFSKLAQVQSELSTVSDPQLNIQPLITYQPSHSFLGGNIDANATATRPAGLLHSLNAASQQPDIYQQHYLQYHQQLLQQQQQAQTMQMFQASEGGNPIVNSTNNNTTATTTTDTFVIDDLLQLN